MESYQLEDPIFGGEESVNPAFLNGALVETPTAPNPKAAKSRRTGVKPQPAKPATRPKCGTQPLVQWQYVSPHQLHVRQGQPRQMFDPVALSELAASVQLHGVLQPILVRPLPPLPGSSGEEIIYEIIAGERRCRASQAAGLTQVPIQVQHLSNAAASEIALIENLQRQDLTPLETGGALMQMTEQGYTIRKLATKLGKQKGWVEHHLMLTRLPDDLRELVSGRPDSSTHARELEKVTDPRLRAQLITRVRDEDMTLSELRRQIRQEAGSAAGRASRDEAERDEEQGGGEIVAEAESTLGTGSAQDADTPQDVLESVDVPESIMGISDAPQTSEEVTLSEAGSLEEETPEEAMPDKDQAEAPVLEAEQANLEAGCLETNGASAGATSRRKVLKANLRTFLRDLEKLDRPEDPAILAEMTQLLQETQKALTTTLERWEA